MAQRACGRGSSIHTSIIYTVEHLFFESRWNSITKYNYSHLDSKTYAYLIWQRITNDTESSVSAAMDALMAGFLSDGPVSE